MSRSFRVLLVFALLFGVFAVAQPQVALAQNTQFDAYISSIQVANLDPSAAASIALTAFNPDGSQNGSPLSDSIPVNGSKTYFPISNVSAGFSGSIVISSNKNVAAISNIVTPTFTAGASYIGRSGGSNKVFLPLLQKGNSGYTSWYSVQNAGGSAANITVTYSSGLTRNATIAPGAATVFYQAEENHGTQKTPSAIIDSNQPIVAAVIQERNGGPGQTVMFAYTGFAGGVPVLYFPLINANNARFQTGISIQNAGNAATTVTVSYTPALDASNNPIGTACTETREVPAGASALFALRAFALDEAGENCAAGARFVGAARVTTNSANQPLIGVVNQLQGSSVGSSYGGFSDADAGREVVLPLIMDRNSGYFTGFNIQNIGAAATAFSCTFSNQPGATVNGNLAPGAVANFNQNNSVADKYVGAVTCTGADPAAKLVVQVNQFRASANDELLTYEGIKR